MSYKYTVVIVRPSKAMDFHFKGDKRKCKEVALDLAVHALKEDLLLGNTRTKVAYAIGESILKPRRGDVYTIMEEIKLLEKKIRNIRQEMTLGLLQQIGLICKDISEDSVVFKGDSTKFKPGEYEFRIVTCRDGPASEYLKYEETIMTCFQTLSKKVMPTVKLYVLEADEYEDIKETHVVDAEVNYLLETYKTVHYVKLHEQMENLPGRYAKRVSHYCKFKGVFEITPDLKIPVKLYTKVANAADLGMKNFSKLADLNNKSTMSGRIDRKKIYYETEDPSQVVDPYDTVKAYAYGSDLVPIPKEIYREIENAGKRAHKELKLLFFSKANKIRRHYLLGRGEVLVPFDDSVENVKALRAIIMAMIDESSVAICSFAWKNDSKAILYGLFPFQDEDQSFLLYGTALPTSEDVRDFSFARLKQSTEEQQAVLEDFMRVNELPDHVADPMTIFNPEREIVLENVINRGIWGPETPLQRNFSKGMEEALFPPLPKDATDSHLRLGEVFGLKDREIKNKTKKDKKWWAETLKAKLEEASLKEEIPGAEVNERLAEAAMTKTKDEPLYPKMSLKHVSDIRPIKDFEDMINDKTEDNTERAINEMKRVISKMIANLVPGDTFTKAVECLAALRKACIKEDEYAAFNEFLKDLRIQFSPTSDKHRELWQMIVNNSISLIGNAHCRISDVSEEESDEFLEDILRLCQKTQGETDQPTPFTDILDDIE